MDTVVSHARSSRPKEQVRRRSIPLYGARAAGKKTTNDEASSDDSDTTVPSLHRDPLHRRNMLTWRRMQWQPDSVNRLPGADRNNNDDDGQCTAACERLLNCPDKPKFHLARHVTTCHDTTRSTCLPRALWLYRACRTAWLDTLVTTGSTCSTRQTCRVET